MITITASGFCPRQPDLRPIRENLFKCEFDICSRRNTKVDGAWTSVVESVTFVAWNDEARRLAEHLTAGSEITAVGSQETSTWEKDGVQKTRVLYKLLSYDLKRSGNSGGKVGRNEGSHAGDSDSRRREPLRQAASEGVGGRRTEPVPQRAQAQRESASRPAQDAVPKMVY